MSTFFAFCLLPFAFAQVSFEARTDTREAVLGSTVEVVFTLKNADGEQFLPPKMEGFRVVGGPNISQGTTIMNRQKTTSVEWSYMLLAQRMGDYEIGSASVQTGGKTLKTTPFSIKIIESTTSKNKNRVPGAAPDGDAVAFIIAEPSTYEAFVGQQIRVDFRLFTRADVSGLSILQEPKLDGFFSKKLERRDPEKGTETVGGKKYLTQIVHALALFPQESGTLEIGPMAFQLGVVDGGPGGLFGSFFGATREISSVTKALKINVKPLPQPAPESFSGGVGRISMETSLDRSILTTDDAAILTLVLHGNNDPKRLAAPVLELPDGIETMSPKLKDESAYENGEELVMTKTWEYFLLPSTSGDVKIQPAATVFDIEKSKYAALFGQEMLLKITAGKKPIAAAPLSKKEVLNEPKSSGKGISDWWILAFLTAILTVGAGLFYKKIKAKKAAENADWLAPQKVEKVKKLTEKKEAKTAESVSVFEKTQVVISVESSQKRLEKARFLAQTARLEDFFIEIQKAAEARFSEKTGLAATNFSRKKWLEKVADLDEKNRLEAFLKKLEMARFAGLAEGQDLMAFWSEAVEVLS